MSQKGKGGSVGLRPRGGVVIVALKILGFTAVLGFLGLMFAPVLMSDNAALRTIMNAATLLGAGALYFQLGASAGEDDCKTDFLRVKAKAITPDALRAPRAYSRGKTLLGALLGASPFVILGVVVAVNAVPYTYALQDLPGWLNAYMRQPDVGRALEYYNREVVTPITDWLRIGVRFAILPFVYLIASMGDEASLLLDRVSPLLALPLPACYAIGYLIGPARFDKTRKFIESVKSKPRMRLKKKAHETRKRKDDRNQLI
ncbi:MAG: hypothetical protein LBB86_00545 [Oscillospiraceae bacterium]|jgi:hypothetical protein|nr:hypothetical protein [Oscillospiraceae bacterium]